jgi:hypothetical protein
MITVQGTVKNGMVRLPATVKLSDGWHVMITIFESNSKRTSNAPSKNIEAEDVDFVRAGRGHLAMQLRQE